MYEELSDEQLEDSVFERYRLMAEKNIENVPEPERTLMVVYGTHGVIGNGGFRYFFESNFVAKQPYKLISESYKNLGLVEHAKAILKLTSLFPNGEPHENLKERNEFLDRYFESESPEYLPEVEAAENIFFENHEEPYRLCIKYVRENT